MGRILVGTAGGLAEIGGRQALGGRTVTALATDGARVWTLADARSLLVEDDDGWREIADLPNDVEGASLLTTADGVLVGTEGAHLFHLAGDRLERVAVFEDAPGRATWYTPWGGPPAVRAMTATAGETFVNVHVGGILRSRDLEAWEQTIDIDTDVHQVVHDADGRLVAPLGVEGVAVSIDRGDSWDVTTDGLHGTYVRAAAVAGDAVIVAASTGPFTKHAALYRRARTGSGAFEPCGRGLPDRFDSNVDTHWLSSDGRTVAVVSPEGNVYASSDEGASWDRVAEGVGTPRCLLVA